MVFLSYVADSYYVTQKLHHNVKFNRKDKSLILKFDGKKKKYV